MPRQFRILSGADGEHIREVVTSEDKQKHLRNVNGSLLQGALDTWGDIWHELQDSMTHGLMVSPEVKNGFEPKCGWPEFLEKMWLLKHYLDHAKRLCEEKA